MSPLKCEHFGSHTWLPIYVQICVCYASKVTFKTMRWLWIRGFMHKKIEKCLGINPGVNKEQQREPHKKQFN